MLRQAVQGARWYQHVARRCPVASSPLILRNNFSTTASRFLKLGGPNDKVNFFEQDTLRSKNARPIDPEAEDRAEAEEVKHELSKLDEELRFLKEDPFGPDGPFIKSLPEKDRVIALEALRKYEAEEGQNETEEPGLEQVFDEELDEMLKEEFEGLAKEEEDWQPTQTPNELEGALTEPVSQRELLSSNAHPYAQKFKSALTRVNRNRLDDRHPRELWAWYRRCKNVDSLFLRSLSSEEMALLWDSQSQGGAEPAVRSAHLQSLYEDTVLAGRQLSEPQTLALIRALHDNGETSRALDKWESYQTSLSQSKDHLDEYWKLGVQLFAADNDPQRAQDIALAFLANDQSQQSRVLIPVIIAWAKRPEKGSLAKAWTLYLQLKILLGQGMKMEDYDAISIGLLKAGRLNLALAVFKDMMVTGTDPVNDSTALYKAALGLTENLQATSVSEKDVNKISLSALTFLPRRFQNRFFYASWMKKLIGMGEVDSAALVVELMYERGVRPDTKHLNGVIAGWLRDGHALARDKAERLGWAMIQQRIDNVWEHGFPTQTPPSSTKPTVPGTPDGVHLPKFLQRTVPPATIETFSILLLHYSRRGDDDMIKYLIKCLGDACIQPNVYFMNHLLYAELRKQDVRSVWDKFVAMSSSIKPDLETFACLWDCCKVQYDRGRWAAFHPSFPQPRSLFKLMIDWHSSLSPRSQRNAKEDFSRDLYEQIIRSFCLKKDLQGTLVAMYALKDIFGFFPDDNIARMLILQVASMAAVPEATPRGRLRRLSSRPKSKEHITHAQQLLEILSDRRAAALEAQGLSVESLDPIERQLNQLGILADFLRLMMTREFPRPDRVEKRISAAAEEMGVSDLDVGPPLGDAINLLP